MAYNKQTWVDGVSPLNAERLNHMEDGIFAASSLAFDPNRQSLPVLYLNGDTTGMTKDVAVDLAYVYGDLSGTASVKWQGSSSVDLGKKYGKFNYTIKFDQAFEAKEGWGEQKKYCLKANWMEASHARNLIGARLWGKMCASRTVIDTDLQACPNWGAVDGFPIVIMLNGEFLGLFTWNIPKDGWMLNMGSGTHEAILCAEEGDSCCFKAPATLDGDFDVEYISDENDTSWAVESLNRLINACINSDGSDIDTVIAQYLDIDSAIDYLIHVCVTANPDNLDRNYLLSTKDGVKWKFTAYDMDTSFGLYWAGKGFTTADDSPFFGNFADRHRLMYLLWNYKADTVKARYKYLRAKALSEINMAKMVLDFDSTIPLYVRNAEADRWPLVPSSGTNTVFQIIEYLRLRYPRLDAEVEAKVQLSPIAAPVLAKMTEWYNETASGVTPDTITSVAFASSYEPTGSEDAEWACDVDKTGTIKAYRNGTDVTIAPTNGATKICLNQTATHMFANTGVAGYGSFANIASVTGSEVLVAQYDTNASEMFTKNTAITNLEGFRIPDGVTNVNGICQACTSLTKPPVLPDSVKYMKSVFLKCEVLESAPAIPSSAVQMNHAFQECYQVTSVDGLVIPESVTDMWGAFMAATRASGTIEINAQNLTAEGYGSVFHNAAKDIDGTIILTGTCPLLAEIAATNTLGKVTVATA